MTQIAAQPSGTVRLAPAKEASETTSADEETQSIIARFGESEDLAIRGRREPVPIRTL